MTVNSSVRGPRAAAFLATLAVLAGAGGSARAHDDLVPAIEQAGGGPRGPQPWQVAAGFRTALFRGAGYDPFSTNDAFSQFSATATWSFPMGGAFSTAVGAGWDAGSSNAQARGADTSLSLSRLGGVAEERFAPRPWAYAFARLSPGWLRGSATLTDPAIPAPLRTSFSTFGVDASLGAAARVSSRASRVGFWLLADAGYSWAPDQHLALAPALPASDADKAGVTTLADLSPRGVFFRGAIALAF
jgi:hypothetical protein